MRMLSLSEHPVNLTDDPVPSSAHVNGLSNDLRRAEETRVVLPISARTPTSDTKRDTSSPSFAAARSGVWYMFWFMRKCTSELVEGPCTPPPGGSEAQAPQAQAPAGSRRLPQDPAGSRRLAPPATHRPRRLQDPTLLSRVCGRREGCGPVLRRSVSTSAIIALQTEIYCSI